MTRKQMNVRLDDLTRETVKRIAERWNMSESQVITRGVVLLEQELKSNLGLELLGEQTKIERKSAGRPKTMKTYTYRDIVPDTLTTTDLRAEAEASPTAAAYRITIYDATGTRPAPETAEALYVDGRLGIAWGADATWAHARDVESGIEMWLNDGDAWEAAR